MEEWKAVPGWEGAYEVSSEGRVRSLDRTQKVINRFGNVEWRRQRGTVLRAGVAKNGYAVVSFTGPGRARECWTVHRLVMLAFVGPCPPGLEVCHDDGTRDNNRLSNLRYDTRSKNALDKHRHGTMIRKKGEDHFYHKLTEDDVRALREYGAPHGIRWTADWFGVSYSTIKSVLRRESWKHVV